MLAQKIVNTMNNKNSKIRIRSLPLKERIRLYNGAMSLRKKYGWGYLRISRKLSIPIDVVRHWIHHGRNPIRQGHPNLFEAKPRSELAYVIGVVKGDADLHSRSLVSERSGRVIRLRAKDEDFVKKFASTTAKLLEKENPYKISFENGQYRTCAYGYYFFEFLRKPLEELEPFIEAYPINFIRGLMDSEGSAQVNVWRWKNWKNLVVKITVTNTNLKLLRYLHELLRKYLNIRSNIKPSHKKGSKFKSNGKEFIRRKDSYDLVIHRKDDVKLFALKIAFSIAIKQQKLLDAIKIIENFKSGPERASAWLKLYQKKNNRWVRKN